MEKLGIHRVAKKFVRRSISQDRKDNRVIVCRELLDRANGDDRRSQSKLLVTMKHESTVARQKPNHHSGSDDLNINMSRHTSRPY